MRRLIMIGKLKGKKSMIVDLQAFRELKPERRGRRNREKPTKEAAQQKEPDARRARNEE
jgi:hypothetical protein